MAGSDARLRTPEEFLLLGTGMIYFGACEEAAFSLKMKNKKNEPEFEASATNKVDEATQMHCCTRSGRGFDGAEGVMK